MNPRLQRISPAVRTVLKRLEGKGHAAFVVGGAVRDLLLGRTPRDWDVATDATPESVQKIFSHTIPVGLRFGTVSVRSQRMWVQVTTFRAEGRYMDHRRPSEVKFIRSLEADLARRDFTINAMALDRRGVLIDPFGGARDLKRSRLRSVGDPDERFCEDSLRAIRAARFLAELQLSPDAGLATAARRMAPRIRQLSGERIRDELQKLLLAPVPSVGLRWLERTRLLKVILPELVRCKGVRQGGWHAYDVYRHTLEALDAGPPELTLRLALLLHDLAKPFTRTRDRSGYHFYRHEHVGAKMATQILKRLRFPNRMNADVTTLVRHHLFEDRAIASSEAATRRWMRRVGREECVDWLLVFRRADARGCGPRRRASPALRTIARRIEGIRRKRDALTLRDLAIDGRDIMRELSLKPGPRVGEILQTLLDRVVARPSENRRERLLAALKHLPGP